MVDLPSRNTARCLQTRVNTELNDSQLLPRQRLVPSDSW